MIDQQVRAGTLAELQSDGRLLTKVGSVPVVVFWHDSTPYAIEDRCPHLGFPLHQGTVEAGLVTCHWHHARFDLVSGCTLDMWADDARGFTAEVRDGEVFVGARADDDPIGHLQARLRNGLEEGITLVIAKSVLGLLDAGVQLGRHRPYGHRLRHDVPRRGLGRRSHSPRRDGQPLPPPRRRRPRARARARLVVRRERHRQPGAALSVGPLPTQSVPMARLGGWYRRFIDTRSSDRGRTDARDGARRSGAFWPRSRK